MKNLLKNTKGAVTVFVTLLLIPAILVSGTAVDLTRMHTARSIVQDGNQLAANSVLSQYNALLHDLYGVFGIAKNDPILAELLDEYISITVFGESSRDTTTVGVLQLFYGSNITIEELHFDDDKNLRNPDVLLQQIEEYMKFRGPVIIVKEVLELLGSSTFKEDTGVINDKLAIDDAIAEIYDKYKELYDAILYADKIDQTIDGVGQTFGTLSSALKDIRDELVKLRDCYKSWENESHPGKKSDFAAKYAEILVNIQSRTAGGPVGNNWINGGWSGNPSNVMGLNARIANGKISVDTHKVKLDNVVTIARQIDAMKDDLAQKIDELERRVLDGDCNEELKAALTEKSGTPPKSLIEQYRDILKWDNIEGMANVYRDSGYHFIDITVKDALESIIYRNKNRSSDPRLSREQLASVASNGSLALSEDISASDSLAATLAGYSNTDISYNVPIGFVKFGAHTGDNRPFFEELTIMMSNENTSPIALYDGQEESGSGDAKKKQESMIDKLLSLVNSAYTGIANNPLGAKYINDSTFAGSDEDISDISEAATEVSNHPVASVLSNPYSSAASASEYLLLLTYSTSMFSNYTTARPEINGKKIDEISDVTFPKSVSGIPITPEVNYFFQSEWEYLYNGNENAAKNLSAVSRLIYLVRMICNYITVFSVSEVTSIVNSIRTAFSWCAPVGLVLGELARAAFVAAESAVDLMSLRAGYKIPLIKSGKSGEWVCSPSGVVNALTNILSETVNEINDTDGKGLSYSHYMLFFFLAKGIVSSNFTTELTERTGNLIEWNMLNYKKNVLCDEEKMEEILSEDGRFRLEDMKTDFTITTAVDMRMLFLSMVFARNYSDSRGLGMHSAMQVRVTDYRGY